MARESPSSNGGSSRWRLPILSRRNGRAETSTPQAFPQTSPPFYQQGLTDQLGALSLQQHERIRNDEAQGIITTSTLAQTSGPPARMGRGSPRAASSVANVLVDRPRRVGGQPEPAKIRKILSLDGGGVRGLSIIMILKHLMRNLNRERGVHVHPWEEFDMIGGTSTGGIIAIMLGRLHMTLEECEAAY